MFITLLLTSFVIAFVVASIVVFLFSKPVENILRRVVPEEIAPAWARYLKFAIYVMGIGGGVQVWDYEKYITVQEPYKEIVQLTSERWLIEIYRTVINALQSSAMVLLLFFVFALIAVVIVRVFEVRVSRPEAQK
ncbi:MAG: hypothetical protein H6636_08730 [Anaerolineales bacterium]|nr:hypothetical protein [Anaerolineales bacterium]